jgi:hypothetical protein
LPVTAAVSVRPLPIRSASLALLAAPATVPTAVHANSTSYNVGAAPSWPMKTDDEPVMSVNIVPNVVASRPVEISCVRSRSTARSLDSADRGTCSFAQPGSRSAVSAYPSAALRQRGAARFDAARPSIARALRDCVTAR